MPEITCSARKCAYNTKGYCERETVKIDVDDCSDYNGCTCCDSFVDGEKSADRSCCSCTNCAGDQAEVECFATDCIYNENMECSADYISIEGSGAGCTTDTFCDTFRTKHN